MENMEELIEFFNNKNIFITGHTGFKGSWLTHILVRAGANVTGYSLNPNTIPALFNLTNDKNKIINNIGDIRDFDNLKNAFQKSNPDVVIHLAAQPLVRESYKNPRYTYETNIMGTVNILECIRENSNVISFLNVTTDKVYKNNEWVWGYRENEPLDGFDPYSNSKSCSELITHSYKSSFLDNRNTSISTARAGNVIGGGDFSADRIIPDCINSVLKKEIIKIRNPYSIRPYQHVLEPLFAYLLICKKQYGNKKDADYYNVGSNDDNSISTGDLVNLFCKKWGNDAEWTNILEENSPHEASYLKLDCSKIKHNLGWKSRWNIDNAVEKTCEWTKGWINGEGVEKIMDKQISEYLGY